MSWDDTWEKGAVLAMWQDGPGHLVMDTGMQLLTRCGRRVTYLGAQVDTSRWSPVDQPGSSASRHRWPNGRSRARARCAT